MNKPPFTKDQGLDHVGQQGLSVFCLFRGWFWKLIRTCPDRRTGFECYFGVQCSYFDRARDSETDKSCISISRVTVVQRSQFSWQPIRKYVTAGKDLPISSSPSSCLQQLQVHYYVAAVLLAGGTHKRYRQYMLFCCVLRTRVRTMVLSPILRA
jgi:hypothetical protein